MAPPDGQPAHGCKHQSSFPAGVAGVEALDLLAELNRALRALADEHRALVADVHGRFLRHGLAAGDPTQPAARPPDRDLWYCGLIEPNAWGASEIRASFWEALWSAGTG